MCGYMQRETNEKKCAYGYRLTVKSVGHLYRLLDQERAKKAKISRINGYERRRRRENYIHEQFSNICGTLL